MITRSFRRAVVVGSAAVVCVTASGIVAATTNADAAPAARTPLDVSYQVVGKTLIGKQNLTIRLGKSKLTAAVLAEDDTEAFKADLPLPPANVSFDLDGVVPTTATVVFTQVNKVTGSLIPTNGTFIEKSEAHFLVTLENVTIGGVPANIGDSCQTIDPVVVYASTPKGHTFDLSNGGTITSRYRIGDFANCGTITDLINASIPSGNNFISLTLSHGVL